MITNIMLGLLGIATVGFGIVFGKDVAKTEDTKFMKGIAIGAVTDFFDTLGIGAFAPTTALLSFTKLIDDKLIPGTLNISHTIPVVLEAFVFMAAIEIDTLTLVAMIISAVMGSWIGAGIVSKLPTKKVQLIMGLALGITAIVMLLGQLNLMPVGGDEIGLSGVKLVIGCVGNFILGALMSAGVGLYAPCMALVSLLGMNASTAFPIMMGSCAFLMPFAGIKFVQEGAYDKKISLGITLGGIFGVFVATSIVTSLPLNVLKWLVVVVVAYTSVDMTKRSLKKEIVSKKELMKDAV